MTVTVFFTTPENEYTSSTVKAKTVGEAKAKVKAENPNADIYETCIKNDWNFMED